MTKLVECVFCKHRVSEVNDCGVCKGCWCSEGIKWKADLKTKEVMKNEFRYF